MWTGLNLLYLQPLRFAKRVRHEPYASLLDSTVLLHLMDEPVYHPRHHRRNFCNWCYNSSAVVCATLCGVGSVGCSWPRQGGLATA